MDHIRVIKHPVDVNAENAASIFVAPFGTRGHPLVLSLSMSEMGAVYDKLGPFLEQHAPEEVVDDADTSVEDPED